MESLIFLTEKCDGTIKERTCVNGSLQHSYIPKEYATTPTVSTDAVLIKGMIVTKQGKDVMTLNIPNIFVQTPILTNGDRAIMKIR